MDARVLLITIVSLAGPAATGAAQEPIRGPLGAAGTVTLSRTDYDRLLDLAGRRPDRPDTPPVAAALTRADIRVRVTGAVVRATMQVDGEVFRSGAVKVPLLKGATLLDARMADRPLPVIADGDTHVAILSGPSTFAATLDVGSPLVLTPGRASFVLPVPPAGTAIATFDIPGDQTDVHVAPGLVLRRASANGRTTVDATLDPGTPSLVSWSTHDSAPTVASRDVRLLADLKTLVSIGEADVRLMSLVDVTVIQGEPSQIDVRIPAGYEVTGVSGASLERTEPQPDRVVLFVSNPAQRRHQFLLSLERQGGAGSFTLETAFPAVPAAQRETGQVGVEGVGTLEVSAPSETPGLRRMDVREVDPALVSAARQPLLSAFRYQRTADASPVLALDVRRFPDAGVLAAVADRAVATTLVSSEGRTLTEVTLWIRNRAQPFLKVALPAGASMLSVEVAGEPAKPVEGRDGTRVPLLRPGFRPAGAYAVSFVYLNPGTPFARKGDMQMMLPRMDLPVSVVEWELFVPDRFRADRFAGNALDASLLEPYEPQLATGGLATGGGGAAGHLADRGVSRGMIVGRVVDQAGMALPGAMVTIEGGGQRRSAVADANGTYTIADVPSGPLTVTSQLQGFTQLRRSLIFDQRPREVDFVMPVGALTETVTVNAEAPVIDTRSSESGQAIRPDEARAAQKAARQENEPSMNVQNLQRRASGVLPVRMDVPRAGSSHRFVKPLVIDEETVVTFRYKRR